MKRFGAMAVALTAVVVILAPSASAAVGTAKQKEVSVEQYAKTVCTTYGQLEELYDGFAEEYQALPIDDPSAFQSQVVTAAEALSADVASAQKKLKKTRPDIDDGKTTAKLFVSTIEELRTAIADALGKFQAADATSPAFVGDVTIFEVSLNTLTVTLSDPFSDVDDQDLLGAFKDEKSCKDVVTIYGG